MLKLKNIVFEDNGKKISYDYSIDQTIKKYFIEENFFYIKYNEDVSKTPESMAVIPFLSNLLPIAWFAGFMIQVDEIDATFYEALKVIKSKFERDHNRELKGDLIVNKVIKNKIKGSKSVMLFSGGVDAFATYIRIFDKRPDLVTIHGADIEIKEIEEWNDLVDFIETEPQLNKNKKKYIETNLRDFYNFNVDLLLEDLGWWGKIQHGLALIGSIAPLSFINNYSTIYIASSYTDQIDINWGSTPDIDNEIKWANIQTIHDGYELKRQDKVDLISDFTFKNNQNLRLRVCYSELKEDFNCSHCEKCFRTIIGIILSGKDPNNFGFIVKKEFYPEIFDRLNSSSFSKGTKYFWWELMEKAKNTKEYFILEDKNYELPYLERIKNGEIDLMFKRNINKTKKFNTTKYKFILRNKFPLLFKLYKKIR